MLISRKTPFGILACLGSVLVVLHICSAFVVSQTAYDANRFPISLSTEAFLDRRTIVEVSFKIFFPKDDERYVPVTAALAEFLSFPPDAYAKPELGVRVIRTECIPEDMIVEMATKTVKVKGGTVNCALEIAPVRTVKKGLYNIKLAFSTIDSVFDRIGSMSSFSKAVAQIQVEVWPSPQAKQAALRAAEEERRRKEEAAAKIRREQQEAEAREHRQREEAAIQAQLQKEEAEAREQYEVRIRLLKNVGPYVGLALFSALIIFLKREWLWPNFKGYATVGNNMQFNDALEGRGAGEPGTILHTSWAKALHGTRKRIKVETFIPEAGLARTHCKLDLLISVGRSVRPGIYLAVLPSGTVRVRVRRDSRR